MDNQAPKVATEWHSVQSYRELTATQKYRRKKGLPIYEKDKQVEPYDVNKGEFV